MHIVRPTSAQVCPIEPLLIQEENVRAQYPFFNGTRSRSRQYYPKWTSINAHQHGVSMLEELSINSPALLGLGLHDGLTNFKAIRSGSDTIVRAQRTHQGHLVFNESLAVRFGADAQIKRLNASIEPLALSNPPTQNFELLPAPSHSRVSSVASGRRSSSLKSIQMTF